MNKYDIYKINNRYYTKVILDDNTVYIEEIEDISKVFNLPKYTIFASNDDLINISEFGNKIKKPIIKDYTLIEINISDAQYAYINMNVIKKYIVTQFNKAFTFSKLLYTHNKYGYLLDKINYSKNKLK